MNLHDLVSKLILDTTGSPAGNLLESTADSSLVAFAPELILCGTVFAILLMRCITPLRKVPVFLIVLAGGLLGLFMAAPWTHLTTLIDPADPAAAVRMEIFGGMLVYDTFTVYMRSLLLVFLILFVLFTVLTNKPNADDAAEIYTLVIGATLGMCLMASANHLLMVFLAVEMASVPSYVLAGMLRDKQRSSEAALKYSVFGAGAAGVMLYGISLLAGLLNTAHLPTMASELAARLGTFTSGEVMVLAFAGLLVMVGIAFKLSAVPFHFWCPDVFEGATAEVNAFLSVASKAAALALLVRVAIGLGTIAPPGVDPGERSLAKAAAKENEEGKEEDEVSGLMAVAEEPVTPHKEDQPHEPASGEVPAHANETQALAAGGSLAPVQSFLGKLIALLAIVTCTFGNLAAYGQTNIKRLMAYSTIAHAGYMMMAVPPVMAMAAHDASAAESAVAALCIYLGIYLFMNLGVFVIIAFLRDAMGSEEIADYAGLIRRCRGATICFTIILFGLIGLPPMAGFIGKFAIFAALVDGYQVTAAAGDAQFYLIVLLVAGGLNTALSLFYYLRVIKVMTMDPEPRDRPPFVFSDVSLQGAYMWLVTAPTLLLFVFWDGLSDWAAAAAKQLLS